eukprot:SAG22_NODE_919_length_6498_cov_3.971402_3_plen_126_part_00
MHEDFHFLNRCFDMLVAARRDAAAQRGVGDDDTGIDPEQFAADDTIGTPQFTRWITVLNYGEVPSQADMDDVVDNLDKYRELLSEDADPTDGEFDLGDFLLLTFDYYLALGCTHMRCIFIDLLLT